MASDSDDYGATRQKDRYSADWLDEVPVNSWYAICDSHMPSMMKEVVSNHF